MPDLDLPAPGPHMLDKLEHPARHKILCMGRRWRKTTLGMVAAVAGHGPDRCHIGALQGGNIWIVDQDHPSATSLWHAVRGMLRPVAKHISEAHRRVLLHGDGAITIKSATKENSLVGDIRGLDGVVMNEGAKFSPLVWQKAIAPAISDRKGWTIWPSTPEGFNYFKDLYDGAQDNPAWAAWREPSTSNPFFDAAEIEARRREGMPDNLIRQEFFAEFILSGAGRTYYEFERTEHVHPEIKPERGLPLDICISFGMAPAAWLVTQGTAGDERALCEIRPDANDPSTRAYVAEFCRLFPQHASGQGVRIFGEVSGKSSGRSDFEAVRAAFPRAQFLYRARAYEEKDRINAVNAILRNRYGEVGCAIDPKCDRLIRDLESTRNTDASFRQDHRAPGVGFYAAAWGAKLIYLYPAIGETIRAQVEERRWPESTPAARRAYSAVHRAIEKGKLVRPNNCQDCGALCKPEAAHIHPGYLPQNDLIVKFLCKKCHAIFDLLSPKGGTTASRH